MQLKEITPTDLSMLRPQLYSTLSIPLDGMWDQIIHQSNLWSIFQKNKLIGYYSLDGEGRLIHFFLLPEYVVESQDIFRQVIQEHAIKTGLTFTNHPQYLSLSLDICTKVQVHSYLFTDGHQEASVLPQFEGLDFTLVQLQDLDAVVAFGVTNVGAPAEWLKSYFENLINKEELFKLSSDRDIMGTCEVRGNTYQPQIADLGAITAQQHRKKGVGTFLLGQAKAISIQRKLIPICSCEASNIGSRKMIERVGFGSWHRILEIKYD
ncbi:MAG: hypothetical protein DHS20C18_27790 [Saprospiraceae bacterium]|nr:MAG: hypothetical protein DHS20C18_27790 [Saprospiraceae bacterium]